MARIFKLNNTTKIVCDAVGTRCGFRHNARLFINGYEQDKAKCCYYNRTWERFEFETVLLELLEKTDCLSTTEKEQFRAIIYK